MVSIYFHKTKITKQLLDFCKGVFRLCKKWELNYHLSLKNQHSVYSDLRVLAFVLNPAYKITRNRPTAGS